MNDELPQAQDRRPSDRDVALMKKYPERAKVVYGWVAWPHSRREIAGIRQFLETGDRSELPEVYSR